MPSASDYNAASLGSKLRCTLAYMFVLAARGAVLDQLSDTCMRTLVSRATETVLVAPSAPRGSVIHSWASRTVSQLACVTGHAMAPRSRELHTLPGRDTWAEF